MPDPTTRTSLSALAVFANLQAVLACQAERRSESHHDRFGGGDRVGGELVTHHPAPLADGVDHGPPRCRWGDTQVQSNNNERVLTCCRVDHLDATPAVPAKRSRGRVKRIVLGIPTSNQGGR
jgi:hypothetical protein